MAKYKDISVNDFCDHLCGGGDSLKFWGISINKTEMFEFIQEKTDNFNRVKLQYFILDIRDYIWSLPIGFYLKNKKLRLPFQFNYSFGNNLTISFKTYCEIEGLNVVFQEYETLIQRLDTILRLDFKLSGLPDHSISYLPKNFDRLIQFAEIAEKEYKRVCETAKPNKDDKTDLIVSTLINELSVAKANLQSKEEYNKYLLKSNEEHQKPMWDLSKQKTKPIPYQFNTRLTDTQRGKLFDLLVSNGFIPDKDKAGFIWAFGGEQPQPSNWQPIEWIDVSKTRKEQNIQTLFELLYLLGVDKDTSAKNPNNLYKKMNFCFSGFKNISVKNPYSIQQKTDRQRLLKSIIEEVEKVRAQK